MLRAYRKTADLPLHRLIKGRLGKMLIPLFPAYSKAIRESPFSRPWSFGGRLIRNGHFLNAVELEDHKTIRDFLQDYWSSKASDEFYTGLSHRYETLFLAYHAGICDETVKLVGGSGKVFHELVEIGSGDGNILKHFSRELPSVCLFHGVDLNQDQVEKNRRLYSDDGRLAFHCADGYRWMKENAVPGSIVVTNGGVLEYMTRPELEDLFGTLASKATPCVISLTESIAADHDLEKEPKTFPYGFELSLSHNYVALLKEAGFTIDYVNDRLTTPEESEIVGRWLQVVAHRFLGE